MLLSQLNGIAGDARELKRRKYNIEQELSGYIDQDMSCVVGRYFKDDSRGFAFKVIDTPKPTLTMAGSVYSPAQIPALLVKVGSGDMPKKSFVRSKAYIKGHDYINEEYTEITKEEFVATLLKELGLD